MENCVALKQESTKFVAGGILTVADDLLKNDGQKFIDMMEQLAERRMAREDVSQYASYNVTHAPLPSGHSHPGHNHLPPDDEESYDDEADDDYGSDEDDYGEEDDTVRSSQNVLQTDPLTPI